MSSSSENRALTRRRPSRRQPLRRCKRFRGNPGGGPFLMDITEPVLMHILGFTMWEEEGPDWREREREAQRSVKLWKWTGQLCVVCRGFHRVVRHVAPEKLSLVTNYSSTQEVSLLGTFLDAPWKRQKLVELQCTHYVSMSDAGLRAFARLFETPASLPNLTKLSVEVYGQFGSAISADCLNNLARGCPLLSCLNLCVGDTTLVTPEEFGNFGRLIQQPLNKCRLEGQWMTNAHLDAFLSHQGQSLTYLETESRRISDLAFLAVARHCSQLEKLGLICSKITVSGLSSFLQAKGGLIKELNLRYCKRLTDQVIEFLIQQAPRLERLNVFSCRWFTDECLDRLVQGQLDYWTSRRVSIPLVYIDASFTGVSRAGIERVLAKPNVGNLEVKFRS